MREPLASLQIILLANGCLKVLVWSAGAACTFYRRRWMLTLGFALAAVLTLARIPHDLDAGSDISVVALGGTPLAALIVGSFVAVQCGPRPPGWSP